MEIFGKAIVSTAVSSLWDNNPANRNPLNAIDMVFSNGEMRFNINTGAPLFMGVGSVLKHDRYHAPVWTSSREKTRHTLAKRKYPFKPGCQTQVKTSEANA